MPALGSPEDLGRLEQELAASRRLSAGVMAWSDCEDLDEVVEEIYGQREPGRDRAVSPEE